MTGSGLTRLASAQLLVLSVLENEAAAQFLGFRGQSA
jgi:hypothetical protein